MLMCLNNNKPEDFTTNNNHFMCVLITKCMPEIVYIAGILIN